MKFRISQFGLLALLLTDCALPQGDIPAEDAYAYRFPLHIEQPAEFLAAELPLEVYGSVSDSSLRDLGVYNAEGRAVPRLIRHPEARSEQLEHATPLGMVPLYGEIEETQRRLRMLMQLHDAGATLQFNSDLAEPADPELELQAVIVDLREYESTLDALDFYWTGDETGFIGSVTVADSDDLARWSHLASGTLADLEFEGTRIEQRRLEVDREPRDFLRITWREMPSGWHLATANGIRREHAPEHARQWITLEPVKRSENGREFVFEVGGYPPVDRVDLELPGQNVVVRASVDLRHDPDAGWRRAYEGIFYDIVRSGLELRTEPGKVARGPAAQWRVNIHSGRVDGEIKLRLGWRPDRLLFLSQGGAPFTLATGRAQDRIEQYPHHRLLGDKSLFAMLERSGEAGAASVGERRPGAGAVVMKGARTWTWRTVLVWIGLIAAVGFVGYLVWSLMREGKTPGSDNTGHL